MTAPGPAGVAADVAADADVDAEPGADVLVDGGAGWRRPSLRRWAVFALVAVVALVADQLSKGWLVGRLPEPGDRLVLVDGLLAVVHGRNSGALFGLLPQSAPVFAVVSMGVVGLIVVYHQKAGRGLLTTLALALLLGGAIGNLIDRLQYGYVVDWIDMGIGAWRFWTYNVADACITTAILLLVGMALVPRLGEWRADG